MVVIIAMAHVIFRIKPAFIVPAIRGSEIKEMAINGQASMEHWIFNEGSDIMVAIVDS